MKIESNLEDFNEASMEEGVSVASYYIELLIETSLSWSLDLRCLS